VTGETDGRWLPTTLSESTGCRFFTPTGLLAHAIADPTIIDTQITRHALRLPMSLPPTNLTLTIRNIDSWGARLFHSRFSSRLPQRLRPVMSDPST
jgi:hypothetical protein